MNAFSETGCCLSHCVALLLEHFSSLKDSRDPEICREIITHMPTRGAETLARELGSGSLLHECFTGDILPTKITASFDFFFTQKDTLTALFHATAESFWLAGQQELIAPLYSILMPVLKAQRSYEPLVKLHAQICDSYQHLLQFQESKRTRLFPAHFLVSFCRGRIKNDPNANSDQPVNDLEPFRRYIYASAPCTSLAEFNSRLLTVLQTKFGGDVVELIGDSRPNSIHYEKLYVQVNFVSPYFDEIELRSRTSNFSLNFDIKRFVFSTPFTLKGRSQGSLLEQYKRKTIVTCDEPMPNLLPRSLVIDSEELILTPVEVAIEDVRSIIERLTNAINVRPVNLILLQLALQGSILATVNAGPLELVEAFLKPFTSLGIENLKDSQMFTSAHNKLRIYLKELLNKVGEAILLHGRSISTEHEALHEQLVDGYNQLQRSMIPLLDPRLYFKNISVH